MLIVHDLQSNSLIECTLEVLWSLQLADMTLRISLPSYLSTIGDTLYGMDYRCDNSKCNHCTHLHTLKKTICVECRRICNVDEQKQEKSDDIDMYYTPYVFDYCNKCKQYKTVHEKFIKLYWYPLIWLSDAHGCDSGIDTCSLFTINYINKIINNKYAKIYPKMLVSKSLYNQMIKINYYNTINYYDKIQHILSIHENNSEYVIFLANLQKNKQNQSDSHQIIIVFENKKLNIIDNCKQLRHLIGHYLHCWLCEFGEYICNSVEIIYYSFNINAFAYLHKKEKHRKKKKTYKLSFSSGLCVANSCIQAIVTAKYYNKCHNLFEVMYDKCKYIKYILNDKLITYFPYQWYTTFTMWHYMYAKKWIDYWNVLNGCISLNKFIKKYQRMIMFMFMFMFMFYFLFDFE